MKTVITKRNYNPLIGLSVLLPIYLIIRLIYRNLFESIEREITKLYHLYWDADIDATDKIIEAKVKPQYEMINALELQLGLILVVITLISYLILVKLCKTNKSKFFLLVFFVFLDWIIFEITNSGEGWYGFLNSYKDDQYYVSLLFFVPFLYFIYKETIIGIKEDKTEELKIEFDTKYEDNLKDLDKLLEMNLISKEEYRNKKEIRVKEKIEKEIKETEEYNLLLKSQQKGLLNEEEFKTKVEDLINKKYNKNGQNNDC